MIGWQHIQNGFELARHRGWAAWFAGVVCLAAGCGSDSATPPVDAAVAADAATADATAGDAALPTLDGWQISAATPTFAPASAAAAATVSASFTAQGTGTRGFGACLIADIHGGKPCVTYADCASGALVPLASGHSEYCVAPQGETQKTCWTRNGADVDWCNKVPPPGRAAGTYNTPAVSAAHIPGAGSMTRWTVIACLNAGTYPTFSDGPRPPCASQDPAASSFLMYAVGGASIFTAP